MCVIYPRSRSVYPEDIFCYVRCILLSGFIVCAVSAAPEILVPCKVIKDFITRLIVADGRIDSNEQQHFNEWMLFFKEYCD